jgi:hypothetical protein
MIKFVNVSIGNRLDDSSRNEVFVYDDNDTNVDHYMNEIIDLHINLCEYSGEYITGVSFIKPVNISSDPVYYDKVVRVLSE